MRLRAGGIGLKRFLVGSTGFVGSNLMQETTFDGSFHSSDVQEAYGERPGLLVYAGVRAAKFLANRDEAADWKQIASAMENIERIAPAQLVLISTVDVYPQPRGVDEESPIDLAAVQPYGKNRRKLELWVREHFADALIVRLPALFGKHLRKNFLFDMVSLIPSMLTDAKYRELAAVSPLIARSYERRDDGFFRCIVQAPAERRALREAFLRVGFTALHFTDCRATYQFYDLAHLWRHIEIALRAGISLLNLATEPLQASEIYAHVYQKEFRNELQGPVPHYDFRTVHADIFGGAGGYIFSKEQVLADIDRFLQRQADVTGRG